MDNPSGNSLKDAIEYHLPFFDNILANNQEALLKRPLSAAYLFVEHCVVDVKGGNKDNFLGENWFKFIYQTAKQWYKDRYADAMVLDEKYNNTLGVVLIFNTPFQLNIPLSVAQEKVGDDKRWFCLPNEILENENVFEWFENKPNLETISKHELENLKETVTNVATNTRSINVNLMTASLEEKLHKISNTIPAHIDKAICDILSLNKRRISTSFWEIHLAIEKALKLIILQNNQDHRNTHKLDKLCKIAQNIRDVQIDCIIVAQFISDTESIKQRYGEGSSFTVQEAINNYNLAIEVVAKLTRQLKRKLVMNNARVLISIGPWEK